MEVIRMEPEAPPHRTATAREVLYVLGKRKKDSKKGFFKPAFLILFNNVSG
jgi:hypothetical protein